MKKKLIALILGATMLLSSLPVFASEDMILEENQNPAESALDEETEVNSSIIRGADEVTVSVCGEEGIEPEIHN